MKFHHFISAELDHKGHLGEITSIFYQYSDSEATDTELNVLCLNVQL